MWTAELKWISCYGKPAEGSNRLCLKLRRLPLLPLLAGGPMATSSIAQCRESASSPRMCQSAHWTSTW